MQESYAAKSDHELAQELRERWTSLVLLSAKPQSEAGRIQILDHMKDLMLLESEQETRFSVDFMQATEEIGQLKAHNGRLLGFLFQIIDICARYDVSAAKPQTESLREYLEAWKNRKQATEEEMRVKFKQLARQHRDSAVM